MKELFVDATLKAVSETIGMAINVLGETIDKVIAGFKNIKIPVIERQLSYEEAMRYFIEHKKDAPNIAKGVILRQPPQDGRLVIIQCFLDNNNELVENLAGEPIGIKMKVTGLDAELLNTFKDKDIIIVN
jgi:hypothetical protein